LREKDSLAGNSDDRMRREALLVGSLPRLYQKHSTGMARSQAAHTGLRHRAVAPHRDEARGRTRINAGHALVPPQVDGNNRVDRRGYRKLLGEVKAITFSITPTACMDSFGGAGSVRSCS